SPDGGPAPRLLPNLRGMEHRHGDLLPADGVHLLADHPIDLVDHAMAEGEVDIDAGRELAHEPGPDHELVADGLGVRGIFAQGGDEDAILAHRLGDCIDVVGTMSYGTVDQSLVGQACYTLV